MQEHERRFNPEHLAKLDNPERRAMLPPEPLIAKLGVKGEVAVLDLGAGTGYFTLPIAQITDGTVYALDVEPKMLETIKNKAEEKGMENIRYVEGTLEQIPMEDATIDRVVASLVLHETEPLQQALREIFRVLRSGGRCLCVEWEKKESRQGAPLHHRIDAESMKNAMLELDFKLLWLEHPTDSHYTMMVEK